MRNRFGYTLVELLMTMAIIGIFLAIILPGFRASRPEQSIEQASSQIQTDVRTAYSYQWSWPNSAIKFDTPDVITIIKTGNPVATHHLPSGTSMTLPGGVSSYTITFDRSKKTFYISSLAASSGTINAINTITITNPNSSTHATVAIDRVTGVAEVRITKP